MANRILLDSSGLKVSKPGVDVFSGSPQNLSFDSTYKGIRPFYTLVTSYGGSQPQWISIPYPSPGYRPLMTWQSQTNGITTWDQGANTTTWPIPYVTDTNVFVYQGTPFRYYINLYNLRGY